MRKQTLVMFAVGFGLVFVVGCSTEYTSSRVLPTETSNTATPTSPSSKAAPSPASNHSVRFETGSSTVGGQFVIDVAVEPYETFVDARPIGADRPRWQWRPTSRLLRAEWAADTDPSAQVESLRKMLAYLVEKLGLELNETKLAMELSPFRYSVYAERLARHAAQDPEWRAVLKRHGSLENSFYRYIVSTTRRRSLHPELDELFAPHRYQPQLDTVEKCLLSTARPDQQTRQWLREHRLPTKRSLPLGCLMADFALEPVPRAQYLANAGVMIAVGSTKVLFDPFFRDAFGLYELVPKATEQALFTGAPPFDGVDAIFISHHHGDHFSPAVVAAYMRAQPEVALIAPEQAVAAVLAIEGQASLRSQTRSVRLRVGQAPQRLSVGNIEVEAVRIPHTGWPKRHRTVENIAYRVRLANRATVVHLGDADVHQAHFARHEAHWRQGIRPSVAFPPYWFFQSQLGRSIIDEYLRADHTIGVHVPTAVPDDRTRREPDLRVHDLFTRPGETRDLKLRRD